MNEIATTQQVWAWQHQGELARQEKPVAAPGPGEVLVANRLIGLNPVDWKIIDWGHACWQQGHVPGVDGVGLIVARGEGVNLPLGARVAYHQTLSRDGSFAAYTRLAAAAVLLVPEGLSDELAAAAPCPGLTAWQALNKVPLEADRDVLVTGAGGAVGLLLAQMAVAAGWRVWVTASSRHRDRLLALGISGVFDYRDDDWRDVLQQALGPRRMHVVFDTVSGEHARSLAALLGYNGHLVCIQDRLEHSPLPAFGSAISLHEVALNSIHAHGTARDWRLWREAGTALLEQLRAGSLQVPALHRVDFAELPEALAQVKAGKGGKWLVQV